MPTRECALSEEEKTKDELIKLKRTALAEQNSVLSEILEPDSIDVSTEAHICLCIDENVASAPNLVTKITLDLNSKF